MHRLSLAQCSQTLQISQLKGVSEIDSELSIAYSRLEYTGTSRILLNISPCNVGQKWKARSRHCGRLCQNCPTWFRVRIECRLALDLRSVPRWEHMRKLKSSVSVSEKQITYFYLWKKPGVNRVWIYTLRRWLSNTHFLLPLSQIWPKILPLTFSWIFHLLLHSKETLAIFWGYTVIHQCQNLLFYRVWICIACKRISGDRNPWGNTWSHKWGMQCIEFAQLYFARKSQDDKALIIVKYGSIEDISQSKKWFVVWLMVRITGLESLIIYVPCSILSQNPLLSFSIWASIKLHAGKCFIGSQTWFNKWKYYTHKRALF